MTIWIAGHSLTAAQTLENAQYVYNALRAASWTRESACGILGNMKRESSVNPGLWENYPDQSGGYGLVQWTPATNYTAWAVSMGLEVENMDSQLMRIFWELQNGEQYYATRTYPMNFLQFTQSEAEPGYLAECFVYCYERPSVVALAERVDYARYLYDVLADGVNPTNPDPLQPKKKKHLKVMKRYYIRG